MRLITASVSGFGRLVDVSMNVDSKLIAIVGPNEAGKTTFLRALRFLTEGGPLDAASRSRAGRAVTDESRVVSATFVLEDADKALIDSTTTEQIPNRMTLSRPADASTTYTGLVPRPQRPRQQLKVAAGDLLEVLGDEEGLRRRVTADSPWAETEFGASRDFIAELKELLLAADEVVQGRDRLALDAVELTGRAGELAGGLSPVGDEQAQRARKALLDMQEWASQPDPEPHIRKLLFARRPTFLLFGAEERDLRSSYDIDELVADPPPPIRNLAGVAELSLEGLVEAIQSDDLSRRESALRKANRSLERFFATVWTQSNLAVELRVDGGLMLVNIVEDDDAVTPFDERSAGLRAFIALVTFLRARAVQGDVVLLIDEAENHLHIDAQVDLVNMLQEQEEASRVIYTTHSPACLPLDLGRSVRAILPSGKSDQTSRVSNSFWTEDGPGFSPLLVAMGAGAAAFSVARRVVLGEGATEMLLLPALLRSVEPETALDFQVAPGLAETPSTFYDTLDLQGARVAYLVDGDDGGTALRAALVQRGIPERSIVQLPLATLERFIEPGDYLTTVRELAADSLGGIEIPDVPTLQEGESWFVQIDAWLSSFGARRPSKVAVANRLFESGRAVVAPRYRAEAVALRQRLEAALGPATRPRTR